MPTTPAAAWIDFERNQIEAFGAMPFFLAIGNHPFASRFKK
ncbi:MAG: hypothetical protein ABSG18_09650 [Steroidobacteraceae bacterium]|jgi:hypothetical protein